MNTQHKNKNNDGMALLLALFFAGITVVLVTALAARTLNQRSNAARHLARKECLQGLEAAFTAARADLERGGEGRIGLGDWDGDKDGFQLPQLADEGLELETLSTLPHVNYFALAQHWGDDGIDNDGDRVIDNPEEDEIYTIHAVAEDMGERRQTESVVVLLDVNVWNNAIFAGSGAAGGLIQGNASIHGSVHLLGANVPEGTAVIAAIDLIGSSLIHNNYGSKTASLDPALLDYIPPLGTITWNGERVETLEAKLRVKRGLVGLSGNAEIGQEESPGDRYKESMDGVYVTDGWTGNAVDGDGNPSAVYSDNGFNEGYDLGDKVPFPGFGDVWRDEQGNTVWNNDTGDWYTHEDYFTQVLLADAVIPTDGVFTGDIELHAKDNKKFYWNATTGEYQPAGNPAVPPAADDDYILFDPVANMLEINGQIRINGNFSLEGQGNDVSVDYTGRGAILVDGEVLIDTDFRACNNGNKNDTTRSFPENNIVGIMSTGQMKVGMSAQIEVMGAFYSAEKIVCSKQTTVLGTFVSEFFDMGSQVPDIYQVPELANHLPFGMIGNFPVKVFSHASWREIGVELPIPTEDDGR
jgi:hypothetical protein